MSSTTVINSKAIQALISRSESQSTQPKGSSFHQLLEGALSEEARAETSPAGLTKSTLRQDPALGSLTAKLSKTASTSLAAHKPEAAKQLASSAKTPGSAAVANDDLPGGDSSTTGPSAATSGAKATPTETPKLDTTQLKVINAPALPDAPAAPAHAAASAATARTAPGGVPRGPTTAFSQGPVAGAATASATLAPRGFAAALASAHVANALPPALIEQASFDPSLQMSVTPQAAHLSMDTGATGPLIAQLQITNGVADVRLTGDAASLLARHGAELSLGLTAAGLQPGRVEITAPAAGADLQSATSDGSGAGAFRHDAQARDGSETQDRDPTQPPRPERQSAPTLSPVGRTSRLHVKA
jgi:hypothetical protein